LVQDYREENYRHEAEEQPGSKKAEAASDATRGIGYLSPAEFEERYRSSQGELAV
jgi:hypothetical protein